MWDRKEIKAKGKAAYRANRLTCIIAALLLIIASGGFGSGASVGSSWSNIKNNTDNNSSITQDIDDIGIDGLTDEYSGDYEDFDVSEDVPSASGDSFLAPAIIIGIVVILLVVIVFATALGIFLLNPLQVGLQKFFIDNATDQTTGLNSNNVGLAFKDHYMKIVGSMFTTGLFTALWTLLLIIPGIYKSYCWRMVPYIISENPTITGTEARAQSAQMMNGNKWASFVLDLSFLGWQILGLFTLGILNLVFTNPYQSASNAELYLTLSGRPSALAAPAESVKSDAPEVTFEFDQDGSNE